MHECDIIIVPQFPQDAIAPLPSIKVGDKVFTILTRASLWEEPEEILGTIPDARILHAFYDIQTGRFQVSDQPERLAA
ncbi:MAG: hypothetical protein PHH16_04665 [Candidatus Gracilibacteria bacterium]|nr:hypothetical protein [Candidatus Gracilibacteria bacterium]